MSSDKPTLSVKQIETFVERITQLASKYEEVIEQSYQDAFDDYNDILIGFQHDRPREIEGFNLVQAPSLVGAAAAVIKAISEKIDTDKPLEYSDVKRIIDGECSLKNWNPEFMVPPELVNSFADYSVEDLFEYASIRRLDEEEAIKLRAGLEKAADGFTGTTQRLLWEFPEAIEAGMTPEEIRDNAAAIKNRLGGDDIFLNVVNRTMADILVPGRESGKKIG